MTWLRLAKTISTQGLRPRLDILEAGVLSGRVWPTDLDFNVHVNNGRYLTMADLGRIDWFLRTGMLRAGLQRGWRPIIATGCVRFSRPLKPWQPYSLHTNLLGWDDKWAFMEHRFLADNRDGQRKLFASVVIKGAFQGRKGVFELWYRMHSDRTATRCRLETRVRLDEHGSSARIPATSEVASHLSFEPERLDLGRRLDRERARR